MTRRRRGTGSIEETDDGRFRPRMVIGDEKRSFGIYATREEAEAVLSAVHATSKGAGTKGGLSLKTWGDIVLDRRERAGMRSIQSERQRWACYVAAWGCFTWPLRGVSRADVKRWQRGLKVAPQTQRNALNLMRAVFREALEDELIESNPCDGVKVKAKPSTEETSTHLTLAELDALLWSADPGERAIVAIAAGTGMRQGEMRSLMLRDVHLEGDEPHIVVRYGSPGKATKNGRIRTVPLFGLALHAMRAWVDALPAGSGIAFPTVRGCVRPKGRMVMPASWAKWMRRARIRRTVRWHDLRHTCATLLLQGAWGRAWTLEEVKEMLGHSSVRVTERYAKATGTLAERAAKAMGPRKAHDKARNGMQNWEPTMQNDSERRGSDSNRRMTVLQGVDKRKSNAHLASLLGLARALDESAAAYMRAMADSSPFVGRLGTDLAGTALDVAAAIRSVASPVAEVAS